MIKNDIISKYKIPIIFILIISLGLNVIAISTFFSNISFSKLCQEIFDSSSSKSIKLDNSSEVKNRIPTFYTKDLEYGKNTFDKNVETKKDYESWKKYFECVNDYNVDNFPLMPTTIVQETEKENYTQKKIEMEAIDGDTIIFYELLPNILKPPYSAVFILPGSGNTGARDVIGEQTKLLSYYYHSNIGVEIVKRGYAVYVIEHRGYGERAIDVGKACNTKTTHDRLIICPEEIFRKELASIGIDLTDLMLKDSSQVLKHIHSNEYIDTNRIALAGLSMGGFLAAKLSAHNSDVVIATIIASGTGSYSKVPFIHQSYVSNLLCCDPIDEIVARIPPRPLYVSFGANEIGFLGWEAKTNYSGEILKRVYEILDADHNLFYVVHEGKHGYHVQSVLEFLDKIMGEQ